MELEAIAFLKDFGPYAVAFGTCVLGTGKIVSRFVNWAAPRVEKTIDSHIALVNSLNEQGKENVKGLTNVNTSLESINRQQVLTNDKLDRLAS